MSETTSSPTILLICSDLIFTSNITVTARHLAMPIRVVGGPENLDSDSLKDTKLVVVDLTNACGVDAESLASLRANLPASAVLLGYGSHVDVDRLNMARQAGCEPVLPRSRFVEMLPDLLRAASRTG